MSTSTFQNFISQATDVVKELFGLDSYPQSNIVHERQYLNDIAKGNWVDLTPVKTSETNLPVVGFPAGYVWDNKNLKIRTNYVRYPFLDQIKQFPTLRPTKTNDRSQYLVDENYKMKPGFNRKSLITEIRGFNRSGLKPIPSGTSILTQAKDTLSSAIGGVKEALGVNYWPQSQTTHDLPYLNDIVKGNWKSLNKVSTTEETMPVVGVSKGFNLFTGLQFKTHAPRQPPYLQQIRDGTELKHVGEVPETARFGWVSKDWSMSKPSSRQQLFAYIRGFDRSTLKPLTSTTGELIEKAKDFVSDQVEIMKEALGMDTYPQAKIDHTSLFLNDIAKGNWEVLKHVDETSAPKEGDRTTLLEDVKKGCELNHVQTIEKNGDQRMKMLCEVRGFDSELHHIGSS